MRRRKETNSNDENYKSEENLNALNWRKKIHLVVLDDDVVGTLGLLKLPGPRHAHRRQG